MDYEILTDFRRLEGRTIKSIDFTEHDHNDGQVWRIKTHDKKIFFFKPSSNDPYLPCGYFGTIKFFKP